jgi:hypothetical protein
VAINEEVEDDGYAAGLVLAVRDLFGLGAWFAARGLRLGHYESGLSLAGVADS